jgi:recombination protein RecA
MSDKREAQAAALKSKAIKEYGIRAATTGIDKDYEYTKNNVVDTGSLTLNYMLGTGGWPYGAQVEVFGAESVGKTTILGYNALKNVQKAGGLTAIIATEPDYDDDWVVQHGVDLRYNVTYFPDNGEEAFDQLRDLIFDNTVDYILFDSLGGLSSSKAIASDKPQAYGDSALITWGVKRVAMRAKKNNIGVMYINQARDDTKSKFGGIESPGGRALKHMMRIRCQVKPGRDRFYSQVDGDKLLVGNAIRCVMKKNKAAEGLGKTAEFNFYHINTDGEHPFGIDVATDVITAGKLTGVIKVKGGWHHHSSFPGGKLNGLDKVEEYVLAEPKVVAKIKTEVMFEMEKREEEKVKKAPGLKVVSE